MEFAELMEGIGESESESESAEWKGRGGRPVRQPSTRPSFQQRPAPNTPQYVTQAQLEAALTRSDAKIKTVGDGVTTLTARVSTLAGATKKEVDERKKTVDVQSRDLNQKLQLMAMLPLLVKPPTIEGAQVNVADSGSAIMRPILDANGNAVSMLSKDTSSMNMLLPLLLMTGMGGGGVGTSAEGAGDGGMNMMMLAMILALGK